MKARIWPHCDQRVLHAPGVCRYCDKSPDLQEIRRAWGIAFTGQPPSDPGLPCPADAARPPHSDADHRRWHGNRASHEPSDCADITVCAACESIACWLGEMMCDGARDAVTVKITRKHFDALGVDHPSWLGRLYQAEGRP